MAPVSTAEAVAQLETLVEGLLFVSESDHPLEITCLGALPELDERSLLLASGNPAESRVTCSSPEAFFAHAVEEQPWHGPAERLTVARYRAVLGFFTTVLAQARAFRVGAIEVRAYVLGQTADGQWLGVATTLIET